MKLLTLTSVACAAITPFAVAAGDETLRDAVARALPYVQQGGDRWIAEQKCVSCHRVSFMTWALTDAQAHGFEVDAARLTEVREWSRDKLLSMNKKAGKRVGALNLEGVSQVLWSERRTATDDATAEQNAQFLQMIRDGRRDDGLWNAAGQLPTQKRPKGETELVSSMWSVLALEDSGEVVGDGRFDSAIDEPNNPASTEWYAMRLVLDTLRDNKEAKAGWIDELRGLQQSDGGWGWLITDPSDALATGQALYALRFAGLPKDDPAVVHAVQFLANTQNDDGSWTVLGTKENAKDRAEETAIYWGTCWAVIGLLAAL